MLSTGQVLYYPHPLLSMRAKEVSRDISVDALKRITDSMFETMRIRRGVGLAAPQVGVLDRIFVMDCGAGEEYSGPQVFINPVWQKLPEIPADPHDVLAQACGISEAIPGSRVVEVEEGCLSFPGIGGKEMRYDKVLVHFLDLESWAAGLASSTQVFEGLEAQCIQHECEHLDGVTLASRMGPVKREQVKNRIYKIKRAEMVQKARK
jgi:peptide deformylase